MTKDFIKVEHTIENAFLFPGFYNTILDPDSYLNEDEEVIAENNPAYEAQVGKDVAERIEDSVMGDVLGSIEYVSIDSPAYYNYRNDYLIVNVEVDIKALESYCFEEHKENFARYLKDFHSSYDGFISYIETDLEDFKKDYETRTGNVRCRDVMIEYYMLATIADDYNITKENIDAVMQDYQYDLQDIAAEDAYMFATEIQEEANV